MGVHIREFSNFHFIKVALLTSIPFPPSLLPSFHRFLPSFSLSFSPFTFSRSLCGPCWSQYLIDSVSTIFQELRLIISIFLLLLPSPLSGILCFILMSSVEHGIASSHNPTLKTHLFYTILSLYFYKLIALKLEAHPLTQAFSLKVRIASPLNDLLCLLIFPFYAAVSPHPS